MFKKNTIRSIAALLVLTAVASAAGCSSSPSASGGTKGTTIKIVESLTSEDRTKLLKGLADKYKKTHPDVTVEFISPPQENADQKITQMLMAKEDLDAVEVRDLTLTQFVNNGWLKPLDDSLKNWKEKDTLTSAAKSAMVYSDSKTYFIPYGFYNKAVYYRKDILDKANLKKPVSWQEIYDDSKKLTDTKSNRYGWAFRGGSYTHQQAEQILLSNIGVDRLASPTHASYFTKDGKTIFAQPEAKPALEFYKSLYTDTAPKDAIAWGFSETVQSFENGQTSFLLQDPEVIATLGKDMKDGQWDSAPFPTGTTGKALLNNGFGGWGVTSYSKNADAAADFLLFLSGAENNTYFAKNYSTIPIHSNATEVDPYFKDSKFSVYLDMAKDSDTYHYVLYPLQYKAYAKYLTVVDDYYQKYFNNTISVDDLLKFLNDFWMQALKDEGKLW